MLFVNKNLHESVRVMIVDDSEPFRNVLFEVLSLEENIKVVDMASNGKEAIDKALLVQPDVILMDIQMPLMNGFEATRVIKQAMPKVFIIGLSNAADPLTERRMKECGASSLLLKGIPTEQIVREILRYPKKNHWDKCIQTESVYNDSPDIKIIEPCE